MLLASSSRLSKLSYAEVSSRLLAPEAEGEPPSRLAKSTTPDEAWLAFSCCVGVRMSGVGSAEPPSPLREVQMRSIELFAGAGGLALGTSYAGFRHEAVIEWDQDACNTICENQRRGLMPAADWPPVS